MEKYIKTPDGKLARVIEQNPEDLDRAEAFFREQIAQAQLAIDRIQATRDKATELGVSLEMASNVSDTNDL